MERKNKKQSFSVRISERTAFFLGISILILGAAFMIFGIWRGEMEVVFEKAVNICMECILGVSDKQLSGRFCKRKNLSGKA